MSAGKTAQWWRTSRAIGTGAVVLLVARCLADTTFDTSQGDTPADTAVEYAQLNYDEFIVPGLEERAKPVEKLLTDILADPQGTGEELGRREDDAKPLATQLPRPAPSRKALRGGGSRG